MNTTVLYTDWHLLISISVCYRPTRLVAVLGANMNGVMLLLLGVRW